MRKAKLTRVQFVVASCLGVTVLLSLVHIGDLRQEQLALRGIIQDLTVTYDEHRSIVVQLKEYHEQVAELQARNEDLEEFLFNRARTYLIATGNISSSRENLELLSRSGHRVEPVQAFSIINIPVTGKSGFTEADFERIWKIRKAENLMGTGKALVKAEEDYGINALVLAAIIVHESGWGKSAIARDKNNLAGLGAFDGSAYRSAITFATKEESIDYLANLLARSYVSPGGKHYQGPHLAGINLRFSSDQRWAPQVAATMRLLAQTAIDEPQNMLAYLQDRRYRD